MSIPFVILDRTEYLRVKVSYNVGVELVNKRFPTVQELAGIAGSLWSKKFEKTFVCFYLPRMQIDAGAFATAHYTPKPQSVKINLWALKNTEYAYLAGAYK